MSVLFVVIQDKSLVKVAKTALHALRSIRQAALNIKCQSFFKFLLKISEVTFTEHTLKMGMMHTGHCRS